MILTEEAKQKTYTHPHARTHTHSNRATQQRSNTAKHEHTHTPTHPHTHTPTHRPTDRQHATPHHTTPHNTTQHNTTCKAPSRVKAWGILRSSTCCCCWWMGSPLVLKREAKTTWVCLKIGGTTQTGFFRCVVSLGPLQQRYPQKQDTPLKLCVQSRVISPAKVSERRPQGFKFSFQTATIRPITSSCTTRGTPYTSRLRLSQVQM